MTISKETIKEAKQFKTQMLVAGIVIPIVGIGFIFTGGVDIAAYLIFGGIICLGIHFHMKSMINKYEKLTKEDE